MQRLKLPGTSVSTAPSNAVLFQPKRRAAAAGNTALRSGVIVKITEAKSFSSIPLASISASSSSVVAP